MLRGVVAWWGRNPVAGNLLMIICALAGFFSFLKMEKEFWPAGAGDGVFIQAVWPGASPERWMIDGVDANGRALNDALDLQRGQAGR